MIYNASLVVQIGYINEFVQSRKICEKYLFYNLKNMWTYLVENETNGELEKAWLLNDSETNN